MTQTAVQWLPNSPVRITDFEGRALESPPTHAPVPRTSRIRVTLQIGKEQTITTISTEGLRGRWVWSRRAALVLLGINRGLLEQVGEQTFVRMAIAEMEYHIARS